MPKRRASPSGTVALEDATQSLFLPSSPGMPHWLASHAETEERAEQKVEQPRVKAMGCST